MKHGRKAPVNLLIIDSNNTEHTVDVKSSKVLMNNLHKHTNYKESLGKISKWVCEIDKFWNTHPKNKKQVKVDFVDFYILYNGNNESRSLILTKKELEDRYHKNISGYLEEKGLSELSASGVWDVCELCFDQKSINAWHKLP